MMENNSNVTVQPVYAGFWLRFVALLIDSVVLSIVYFIMVAPIVGFLGISIFNSVSSMDDLQTADSAAMVGIFSGILGGIILVSMLSVFIYWLYFSIFESSKFQATPGKMALGLKVTDIDGNKISFGRATGRYFGKIITSTVSFGIGYILAGFTPKKQALHDIIASCLVTKKQ